MSRKTREQAAIRAAKKIKSRKRCKVVAVAIGVLSMLALGFGYYTYVSMPLETTVTADWDIRKIYPTDIVFGDASAPVRITEYGSLTCVHCARFHVNELSSLINEYVDTGKAQLVFRHFPYDRAGLAGATAVSCLPKGQRADAVMTLMERQGDWVRDVEPGKTALAILSLPPEQQTAAENCLSDGKMEKTVGDIGLEASNRGISSTPTFVIGDRVFGGFMGANAMGKIVESQLTPGR